MFHNIATSRFTSFTSVFHKKRKGQDYDKVSLIFSKSSIVFIAFIAFIVFFRKPFFNRITNSTFHKKEKGQEVQKSDHDKNTNLAVNQLKSLNHFFDLFRALIGMSSIGIGMQKIAIHSQIIGLKAVLKISNIVSK